ncbi:MAG TPA: Na/Pi cotransporter family protein [Thermodesulfobacteriota bacterium]|nr:Na/Pi cotransporter family protein [Thermodesulfobacteriota bacterium]
MTNLAIATLVGAVGLLLYGIHLAGDGIQKAAGGRVRKLLGAVADSRLAGAGTGVAIAALLQSSSATIALLVGFVSAGLMTLPQTIAVVLGADVGATLTAQLLAFRVTELALPAAGAGAALHLWGRRAQTRHLGQALLGFALVFLALRAQAATLAPLRTDPLFHLVFAALRDHPGWTLLLVAAFTALVQSSTATLALAIGLAHEGLVDLPAAMPVVLGANLGAAVAAIGAAIGARREAQQVAAVHVLAKAIGVAVALPLAGPFAELVARTAGDAARQIANAHTLFNLLLALAGLPVAGPLARAAQRLWPVRPGEGTPFGPRYLDESVLASPPIAFGQATREVLRMADIVQGMLRDAIKAFEGHDPELIQRIEDTDDQVDHLDRAIKLFLTKLSRAGLTEAQARRELELIAFSTDLEAVGDIIDKNLMPLARKKLKHGLVFSEQGWREIVDFHGKVCENFELAVLAFATRDQELARKLLRHKDRLGEIERELSAAHIERLHRGLRESIETSSIHLDLLSNLQRINWHVTNVAYPVLEGAGRDGG